ncbi:MAG: T9SS type A sorting domain-containing protein [Flavobacteriales bacterium]|nr:T9SS type A sorting domain-containing protein [Flavobacteriales bacterium]
MDQPRVKQKTLNHLVLAVALIAATCALAQQPFELDTTFRTEIEQRYVNSLLPMPDGKLIASGVMRYQGMVPEYTLARLNADGSLDDTYYNSGLGGGRITAWSNRLYVSTSYSVRRILQSGSNDSSFHMGSQIIPYFASGQGGDYHVFPDGRVLMSGNHTLSDTARGFVGMHQLIWFSNEGYLDTTRVHRKGNGAVYQFNELPGGGFICSGLATHFDGHAVDRIFRVHADGSVDTTFHTGVNWGSAFEFLPMADGRVYACGVFRRAQAPDDTLRLVRFMPDGSLDQSFASPVLSLGSIPSLGGLGPSVSNLQPWADGRVAVTGKFQFVNGQPRRGICVLEADGALTTWFDDCGVGPFTYMGITSASLRGIMPDADSTHYYVWGTYTGYSDGTTNDPLQRFVTRLHVGDITTGSAPLSLVEGPGVRVYPNPSIGSVTVQLETLPQDAQVVVRDALGREVQRQRLTDHYTTLSMTHSGVYMLEVWSAGERLSTQRLVVE